MLLHVSPSSRGFPLWPVIGIGGLLALGVLAVAWRVRVDRKRDRVVVTISASAT
jgi:hypothetical protein